MLTHSQIWNALDRLAARNKMTASGLAKKAGLDPTTFNKSKRITNDGRERWPSTESVAKALAATNTAIAVTMASCHDAPSATQPSMVTSAVRCTSGAYSREARSASRT